MLLDNAQERDLSEIYDLICLLEETKFDFEKFKKAYLFNLKESNIHYFVARDPETGKAVGFLSLYIHYQLHHIDKIAEIVELVVSREYRSQMVGSMLYEKAESYAKENQCLQLEVCSNALRERAHKFYERFGMHKFHVKLSKPLDGREITDENRLGR